MTKFGQPKGRFQNSKDDFELFPNGTFKDPKKKNGSKDGKETKRMVSDSIGLQNLVALRANKVVWQKREAQKVKGFLCLRIRNANKHLLHSVLVTFF